MSIDDLLDQMIDAYISCQVQLDNDPDCASFWEEKALPMVDLMLLPKSESHTHSTGMPTLNHLNAPDTIFGSRISNEVSMSHTL